MTQIPELGISDTAQDVSAPRRLKLRTEKEQIIPQVFKDVLRKTQDTLTNFRTNRLEPNRLAVVVSAYDAKELLPETLREITEQIKQASLQGEIFVILNNGGGNTTEYVSSNMQSEQIDKIKEKLRVDDIVFGKTEELAETAPNSKALPRKITTNKLISGEANGINLVVIEQQQDPDNFGKIRALRDVYEYLRILNQETGYCPQYLLAIDAETRIRPIDTQRRQILTDVNSGLSHMVFLSAGDRKMVGAKLQFVPYDGNGDPNWKERTPPMQEAISIMHGMRGYEWLPGGGTLGGFPKMVSILNTISQKLPGTRIEDVLTTVIAKAMGIETVIDNKVVHANRCPSEQDKKAVSRQMERWLKGAEGLKEVAGKSLAKKVISNGIVKIIAYLLTELTKGKKVNVPYLLKGLLPYIKVSKLAKGKPDDFVDGQAVF